jgi:hypothetical protein
MRTGGCSDITAGSHQRWSSLESLGQEMSERNARANVLGMTPFDKATHPNSKEMTRLGQGIPKSYGDPVCHRRIGRV